MKLHKHILTDMNKTRQFAHEILFFDPETTLLFGKCETGPDECKTFPFVVPDEYDNVPLVFSRTFRGDIETYDADSNLIGTMSDEEHQYDGLGSSKIPAGENLFVLLPNTLQYCVSSANMKLKVNGKNGEFLPPNSTKTLSNTDELYLAVYGEAEVDGKLVVEDLVEPGNYKIVANKSDKDLYIAQIKVTQL